METIGLVTLTKSESLTYEAFKRATNVDESLDNAATDLTDLSPILDEDLGYDDDGLGSLDGSTLCFGSDNYANEWDTETNMILSDDTNSGEFIW